MSTTESYQHRFPNGLTVVGERMPSVKSAAFSLLLPAGAIYDPPERLGTAGVLAEWMLRGAGDRDSRSLIEALDRLGATYRVSAQSVHLGLTAATLGRHLIAVLRILVDVVRRPHLRDDDFESVRALAAQSLRSLEDDPGAKLMVELRRRHFRDPWGRHPLGTPEGVAALTPESVRQFHGAHVHSSGAILAAAGDIDWTALVDAVAELLGDAPPCPEPTLRPGPAGPARDHIAKATEQVQIGLALPMVPLPHPDSYQARAAAAILGGYSSARLFTEVREKRGLCYSVAAAYESFRDEAALVCHAGTSSDRAQQTLDVMLAELNRLCDRGVAADELETMRAGLKSSWIMQQESSLARSSQIASDLYYLGRVRTLDEISAALDALTPQSVSRYCGSLRRDQMTILSLGPRALVCPE
ncbi:MAG: peptidase M16 [Isosphaeraceae bacterium]|nr:MAG: peptidase M16 [Isosphaeraceae bacterium]